MNFGIDRFAFQQPRVGMPSGQSLLAPTVAPGASSGGYGGGFSDVRNQIAQAMMPRYGAAQMPNRMAIAPFGQPRMGIQQPLRGNLA